jgi:hypothetical protein
LRENVSISSIAGFLDTLLNASFAGVPNRPAGPAPQFPLLGRFDSSQVPEICLYDYLERLKAFSKSDTSLVVALIYIDRILEADSNFVLTNLNVHRLLLTCTTVAEKYLNDIPYVNTHYATFGGVSLEELNRLEVLLLYGLKWRLRVSPEEYDKKQEAVRHAFMEALCASDATDWIVVKEATCEMRRDTVQCDTCETQSQGSTITGSDSALTLSESVDSSSEVASVVTD